MTVAVIPVPGLPMIQPGDDLAALVGDAIEAARVGLKPLDVVVVCQKVVSKAEGAVVNLDDIEPSAFAIHLTSRTESGKDPRTYEVVLREATRIVRMDRGHVIVRRGTDGSAPTPGSTSRTGSDRACSRCCPATPTRPRPRCASAWSRASRSISRSSSPTRSGGRGARAWSR